MPLVASVGKRHIVLDMNPEPADDVSLDRIRAAVRTVSATYPLARVAVFGSAACGNCDAHSDVDLLVEFVPGSRIGLLEMGALREDLEEILGRPVDVLSRAAVEKSPNPYRRRSILAAPVTVYAR
jgi:predicted nucleotidyltransferase